MKRRDPDLQGIEEWTGHRKPKRDDDAPPSKLSMMGLLVVVILIYICAASMGCASTTIYRDGKPVLRTQANVTGLRFTAAPDGTLTLSGSFDHSTATEASAARIGLAGTVLTAVGATALTR